MENEVQTSMCVWMKESRCVHAEQSACIHVNRNQASVMSQSLMRSATLLHPEWCGVGIGHYCVAQMQRWSPSPEKDGRVLGHRVYQWLSEEMRLITCLDIEDLVALFEKGIVFFQLYFSGQRVIAWKSTAMLVDGSIVAPMLLEIGGVLRITWYWLDYGWASDHLVLRFSE